MFLDGILGAFGLIQVSDPVNLIDQPFLVKALQRFRAEEILQDFDGIHSEVPLHDLAFLRRVTEQPPQDTVFLLRDNHLRRDLEVHLVQHVHTVDELSAVVLAEGDHAVASSAIILLIVFELHNFVRPFPCPHDPVHLLTHRFVNAYIKGETPSVIVIL